MAHWLFKSEPSAWSFDKLAAAGEKGTDWSGIRNHSAKQNMMAMKQGDRGFFYHSNEGKAVVGIVEVIKTYYPDPTDEKGIFKRSPSVRIIARALGVSVETASLLSVLFNFAIIAGIAIWLGRKYLPGMFRDRTAAIQRAIQEAQKAGEEARRRLADIESRLMKLDVEIGMMRDAAEKEGAAEEARIKAASEEEARKIVESAAQEIAAAAKSARRDLTAYAADLAVGLAKKQIHVDAPTDEALVHDFSAQLTSAPSGPGKDAQ